jgi:hypothetical protein
MLGVIFGILLVSFGLIFVIAQNITCSGDGDCGEVSTTFPSCKNETTICTTTTTPTCNNATTNTSSCEDVKEETCWICENGCENRVCLEAEEPACGTIETQASCEERTDCKWKNDACKIKDDDSNETNGNQTNGGKGLGQIIRNRVKAGVYTSPTGEQIRVRELAQNRLLLYFDEESVEAETELEIEEETENNKTKLKAKLSNGRKAEIKIMPGVAAEKALERLRLKVCNLGNNCSIELKEVGSVRGEDSQLAYEVQAERHSRILAMFKAKMLVKAQIDAETGELIRVKKPWWAFLATEPEE